MTLFADKSWFWFALAAALMWGVGYNLAEHLMRKGVSVAGIIVIEAFMILPFYMLAAWQTGRFGEDVAILRMDTMAIVTLIISAIALFGGNLMILYGIDNKNASLANLIGITYPFFVVLFSWLLFRQVDMTIWTVMGGLLILSGAALIYLKS